MRIIAPITPQKIPKKLKLPELAAEPIPNKS